LTVPTNLTVCSVKVLDVMEWSDAGWCKVVLRLDDWAIPVVVDVLGASTTLRHQYRVGEQIQVTFTGTAYNVNQAPSMRKALGYSWTCNPTEREELPLLPSSHYDITGQVIWSHPNQLIVDCGLIIDLSPRHGLDFASVTPGGWVQIRGKLYSNLVS
jgi:hypothetical protein